MIRHNGEHGRWKCVTRGRYNCQRGQQERSVCVVRHNDQYGQLEGVKMVRHSGQHGRLEWNEKGRHNGQHARFEEKENGPTSLSARAVGVE